MSDLKDFLENIRRLSSKIGEVAMRHVSCSISVPIYLIKFQVFPLVTNFLIDVNIFLDSGTTEK